MEQRALEGITIVDFGWAWAGPHLGRTLADMGARVIKVESQKRMDVIRDLPPWPTGQEARKDNSGYYNWLNRNKLGVTLNLAKPRGAMLAKEIIKMSDAVVENYSVGVMKRFGLDYESVKEVKPDIIYVSLTGVGSGGPFSSFVMYGRPQVYISGLAHVTGYPHMAPHPVNISWGDPVGGHHGAFAMLSALHYRSKTGKGQYIELSQWEGMVCIQPENIMDYILNKKVRLREANRHEFMAPHNAYRCKGGDLKWVTIAVATDEEWAALCEAMGNPEWTGEEKFADSLSRWHNQEEMDQHIEEWTMNYTQYEVTERLQKVGVAAFPTLSNRGLFEDPHLNERGYFVEIEHPDPAVAGRKYDGFLWKMSKTPGEIRYRAPFVGEHNKEVFGGLLGMSQKEIDQLVKEEVIF